MDTPVFLGDPDALSRPELISLYINSYYKLDAGLKSRFEAAFRKRRLPLPSMPPTHPPEAPRKRNLIDRSTFISYILLIYSGTAVFYSWIYLAARIAKMDFAVNPRHKLIQSAIALAYVIGEILLYDYFSSLSE